MNIQVTARRWSGGWELFLDDDHVTQARTLDRAAQQVRDYLDTDDDAVDHSQWSIDISVDLGNDTAHRIEQARQATRDAVAAQDAAARQIRTLVRELRAQGVSVTDCAAILGVSRGRVSQLAA